MDATILRHRNLSACFSTCVQYTANCCKCIEGMLSTYSGGRSRSPVEEPDEVKDTEMMDAKEPTDPWASLHAMHCKNVRSVTLERGRFICDCALCYGVAVHVVSKATRTRHRKLHRRIQPPAADPEVIDEEFGGNRVETLRYHSPFPFHKWMCNLILRNLFSICWQRDTHLL
jgi:hypothetical protein